MSSVSSRSSAASRAPKKVVEASAPPKAMASLIIDGKRREVPVAEEESILDAALRAGMDLPFACKGGMCSTCRAKLVEGDAQMEVNYSLEPWELKAGFILTCQARPCSDKVVVDYDHVEPSFRGDAKHRTRCAIAHGILEIPGLVLRTHPGMTE